MLAGSCMQFVVGGVLEGEKGCCRDNRQAGGGGMDRRVGHGRYQECRMEQLLRVPLFPAGSDTEACFGLSSKSGEYPLGAGLTAWAG